MDRGEVPFFEGGQVNMAILTNPIFQMVLGSVISFLTSLLANYVFIERRLKALMVQAAYDKLVDLLVRLKTLPDAREMLPLEIADRVTDLRLALTLHNEHFDEQQLVERAINQAAEVRRKWNAGGKGVSET